MNQISSIEVSPAQTLMTQSVDSTQNSNNISHKQFFTRLNRSKSIINPTQKFFFQDLNQQYSSDSSKFLCKLQQESYQIERKFIQSSASGIKLYYSNFLPINVAPKAQILIIHGFYEHSGLYINFANYFAKQQYEVHLYDQRGYGYSSGISRNMSTVEFHQDLTTILQYIGKDIPLYIYSHSTGVVGLLSYLIVNPQIQINGLVVLNSFIEVPKHFSMNIFKNLLAKFVLIFYGDIIINSKINLSALCKNNYHIKKMIKDEHIMPHLTLKMALSIVSMTQFLKQNAHKINAPIFILHGKDDVVSKYQNSQKLFSQISSKLKKIQIIDNAFHQPHLDSDFESIHQLILNWLNERNSDQNKQLQIDEKQLKNVKLGVQSKYNNRFTIIMILMVLCILYFKKSLITQAKIQKMKCFLISYLIKQKMK